MFSTSRFALVVVVSLALAEGEGRVPAAAVDENAMDSGEPLDYGPPREMAGLANGAIRESSGLAASRLRHGIFFTHNDSGDTPRVFAFDSRGNDQGVWTIQGAEAVDWEDMASFTRVGESWLLLADVGDNRLRRTEYSLYLVPEPGEPRATPGPLWRIRFRYEDGPQNCESVGVDVSSNLIVLVTKAAWVRSRAYQLELPTTPVQEVLVAKPMAWLPIALATGMDISPDGRRSVILTYGSAFEYTRRGQESWAEAFQRAPRRISTPPLAQGEAICYAVDGKTLLLTSEGGPTPLWEIPVRGGERAGLGE